MANIKLENLTAYKLAGVELFSDSESFIQALSEDELTLAGGGFWDWLGGGWGGAGGKA
jgi:hypothetical protein